MSTGFNYRPVVATRIPRTNLHRIVAIHIIVVQKVTNMLGDYVAISFVCTVI